MPGKPVKALIFDMDGVLVNSEPHHTLLEKQLFAQMNLTISDEEHRSYLGKSSYQMWKEIIAKHNLARTADELTEINSNAIIKYFSGLKEIELMPGILDLLEKLSDKGIPLALASSSGSGTIDLILSRAGLSKYFIYKVSSEMVVKGKPDPQIYIYTAGLLSLNPEECLVIEDSFNGMLAAKSAGMLCVAYDPSGSHVNDQNLADDSIDDFSRLPEILQKYMEFQI